MKEARTPTKPQKERKKEAEDKAAKQKKGGKTILAASRMENGDLVFMVKEGDSEIHLYTNEYMKLHHCRALVSFYESHVVLGDVIPLPEGAKNLRIEG